MTTATRAWFFAALRTIEGPPMSMFSMISACVAPAFGDRRLERVEVHDHEVDRLAAEALELRVVRARRA